MVPVLENEIITITTNLKNSAPGLDDIRADVVKHIIHLIAKPLMDTFNLLLEQRVFPNELKLAKVTPIFKNDDPTLFANYRPVSVLSFFSKILEKISYCIM